MFTPVPEVNGATVALTHDAYPGRIFTGTIVRNANAIDQTTRALNVDLYFCAFSLQTDLGVVRAQ